MNNNALQLNPAEKSPSWDLSKYIELGVYITLFCNFSILLGNALEIDALVSWPTRIMILYSFLLGAFLFYHNICSNKVEKLDAWFVALIFFTAFCFLFRVRSDYFDRAVSYMCFIQLPIYMVLYRRIKNISKIKNAVFIANGIYLLLFVGLSFTDNSHIAYGEYGIKEVTALTLGYKNPNETGIYLLISFLIMLCGCFSAWKRGLRIFTGALSVLLFYMVWQTESRTCMILAMLAVILVVTQRFFKAGKLVRTIVLLLPLAALVAVIILPEQIRQMDFMGEIADTGRYKLFMSFLSEQKPDAVLFGDFVTYAGKNMHNSYLSIVAMFGVPAMLLYWVFLSAALRDYHRRVQTPGSYVAYIGLLAIVAHGVAEGTLLVSGSVFAGLAGLLFLLMLPEEARA